MLQQPQTTAAIGYRSIQLQWQQQRQHKRQRQQQWWQQQWVGVGGPAAHSGRHHLWRARNGPG